MHSETVCYTCIIYIGASFKESPTLVSAIKSSSMCSYISNTKAVPLKADSITMVPSHSAFLSDHSKLANCNWWLSASCLLLLLKSQIKTDGTMSAFVLINVRF